MVDEMPCIGHCFQDESGVLWDKLAKSGCEIRYSDGAVFCGRFQRLKGASPLCVTGCPIVKFARVA